MSIATDAEVKTQMQANGVTITPAVESLITSLRLSLERSFVEMLGFEVEQGTRTEYYPMNNRHLEYDREPAFYDSIGGRAVPHFSGGADQPISLKNVYVRSITTVHENQDAWKAASPPSFTSDHLLVEGTDFRLDFSESGLSKSGLLYRNGSSWPIESRTVQVVYVSGFTAVELSTGKWNHFKQAVILSTMIRVNEVLSYAKTKGVGRAGPVASFGLGDFSVSMAQEAIGELYGARMTIPQSIAVSFQNEISMAKFFGV